MKENKKKSYCTPAVKVVSIEIERGYAGTTEPEPEPVVDEENPLTVNGAEWTSSNTNSWFS